MKFNFADPVIIHLIIPIYLIIPTYLIITWSRNVWTFQGMGSSMGIGGMGMVGMQCPQGMEQDGRCSIMKFCFDPKEQCIGNYCCQQGNNGMPGTNDPNNPNGGSQGCPQGMSPDGTCSIMRFCFDPKEQCIGSICCEPSQLGQIMPGPGGVPTVGSSFCPLGMYPDGGCSIMKFCFDPKEQCIGNYCCQQQNNGFPSGAMNGMQSGLSGLGGMFGSMGGMNGGNGIMSNLMGGTAGMGMFG
ncbi:hypothetical protein DdX_14441 [Ditylenchus destructor]|uniref:Uncharacterized protein n=1 Tax=Ditylenchus destructor TaxID=166010 RepID=A0AAD4MTC0_9BILA|nr:hypothetical protein DdX_14441 [Ditylenchus destructor]